jgi:hypothetical protein
MGNAPLLCHLPAVVRKKRGPGGLSKPARTFLPPWDCIGQCLLPRIDSLGFLPELLSTVVQASLATDRLPVAVIGITR